MLWGLWACLILTVGDCNSVAGGYIWLLGLHLSPAHALFGCPWEQQCSALGPAQRWCCHSGWRYLAEKDWKNVFLPRNEYQRERLKLFFLFVFEMVTLRIEQGWEVALKSCRHYSARVSRWTGETCNRWWRLGAESCLLKGLIFRGRCIHWEERGVQYWV